MSGRGKIKGMKVTCCLNAYYNDNGKWREIEDAESNGEYYAATYPVEYELAIVRIADIFCDYPTTISTSKRFIMEKGKSVNVHFPGISYTYNCDNGIIYCVTLIHDV